MIQAQVILITGAEVFSALEDGDFLEKWQALYEQCHWATPFQDHRFVSTWYKIYKDSFRPIILTQFASDGSLVGLLTLADSQASGRLVVAGSHQAEYQVWLSTTECSASFIVEGLQKLETIYPAQSLTFRYLPPLTPMDWAPNRGTGPYCEVTRSRTPLLVLDDPRKLAESLRKKSNKSRLNRLRRLGNVEFAQVGTAAELSPIFDEIISYYDLRQGAVHDSIPFRNDRFKKSFYLALIDIPHFLHVTALKVGKETVAAHLGLRDKGRVYLGIFAHSPFHAQHSPGKLHLLMLGEKLIEGNYSALDLTPGDDPWKERFATAHEDVFVATVYFGYATSARHRLKIRAKYATKEGLRFLGLTPQSAKSSFDKLRNKILGLRLTKRIKNRRNVWLYTFKREDIVRLVHTGELMKRDRIQDLFAFQPSGHGQTRKGFLASCLTRLEKGWHVYTLVESRLLVHYSWLVPQQIETLFPEAGQICRSIPESVCLYDFYNHPTAQGLHPSALRQMLHDAVGLPGTKQIHVAVISGDVQTRDAIEKMGLDNGAVSFQDTVF